MGRRSAAGAATCVSGRSRVFAQPIVCTNIECTLEFGALTPWPFRHALVPPLTLMKTDFPSPEEYAAERPRHGALQVMDVQSLQHEVTGSYRNQVLLEFNDSCIRMAVFHGEYRWHLHPDSDEVFLVVEGELHIDLGSGPGFALGPWQCVTIPAGTVHRTRAVGRTVNLTMEGRSARTVFVDGPELA